MNIITATFNWLNSEEHDILLQRDGVFALISWRDFNAPAQPAISPRTAACLFVLGVALPVLALI